MVPDPSASNRSNASFTCSFEMPLFAALAGTASDADMVAAAAGVLARLLGWLREDKRKESRLQCRIREVLWWTWICHGVSHLRARPRAHDQPVSLARGVMKRMVAGLAHVLDRFLGSSTHGSLITSEATLIHICTTHRHVLSPPAAPCRSDCMQAAVTPLPLHHTPHPTTPTPWPPLPARLKSPKPSPPCQGSKSRQFLRRMMSTVRRAWRCIA